MAIRFYHIRNSVFVLLLSLSCSLVAQTNQLPLIFADTNRDIVLVGAVKSFDFNSPETLIEVEVESTSGQPSIWQVVTKSATELRRLGWTSQSLFPGELVQIEGELIQGSRLSLQMKKLVRTNGQELIPEQENIFDQLVSGTYQPIASQGSIQLSFDRYGFSRSIFYFNDFDASLELNAEDISASQFQLDLLTEDLDSSSFELTRLLKSGVFFDASNFPLISVSATSIEPRGDTSLIVRADVTIKGITESVQFEIQLNQSDVHPESGIQSLGFAGTAQVLRSNWGFVGFAPDISNEILIELQMEFELTPETLRPRQIPAQVTPSYP